MWRWIYCIFIVFSCVQSYAEATRTYTAFDFVISATQFFALLAVLLEVWEAPALLILIVSFIVEGMTASLASELLLHFIDIVATVGYLLSLAEPEAE